uniref:Progestin and adipoQ receptor family member 3-like n=1 Tax=Steinernema glaseri TaxID=37863 RepID=A0A1I7YVA6_9BILA
MKELGERHSLLVGILGDTVLRRRAEDECVFTGIHKCDTKFVIIAPRIPVLILYFGVAVLLIGSSLAHLLHSRSPTDHFFWFLIDFSGIAIFSVCIGVQRYACSTWDFALYTYGYLPSLIVVAILGQYLTTCYFFVQKPFWKPRENIRIISCSFLALWLFIPLINRYIGGINEEDSTIRLHSRAFQWLIVSALFMGGGIPERFAPGYFDYVGYGHQVFHVCILMVTWYLCDAAHHDCPVLPQGKANYQVLPLFATLLITFGIIWSTVKILMRTARNFDSKSE